MGLGVMTDPSGPELRGGLVNFKEGPFSLIIPSLPCADDILKILLLLLMGDVFLMIIVHLIFFFCYQ